MNGQKSGLYNVGSNRHVQANNTYMVDYKPEEDSNYLMYGDGNNF